MYNGYEFIKKGGLSGCALCHRDTTVVDLGRLII